MNGVPILKKHQVTTSNESQNKQSRNIFRNTQREKEKEACVTTLYSTGLCSLTLRFYLVFRLHYDSQGAMVRKTKKQKYRKTRCSAGKPLFIFHCPEKNLSAIQKIRTLYYGLHYQSVHNHGQPQKILNKERDIFGEERRECTHDRWGPHPFAPSKPATAMIIRATSQAWSARSTVHRLPVSLKIFSSGGTTEQRLLRTRVPNFRAFFSELL